jgi:hypothetical protein
VSLPIIKWYQKLNLKRRLPKMPQMLLPIFPDEATTINPLLGFCRKEDMVYYFNVSAYLTPPL